MLAFGFNAIFSGTRVQNSASARVMPLAARSTSIPSIVARPVAASRLAPVITPNLALNAFPSLSFRQNSSVETLDLISVRKIYRSFSSSNGISSPKEECNYEPKKKYSNAKEEALHDVDTLFKKVIYDYDPDKTGWGYAKFLIPLITFLGIGTMLWDTESGEELIEEIFKTFKKKLNLFKEEEKVNIVPFEEIKPWFVKRHAVIQLENILLGEYQNNVSHLLITGSEGTGKSELAAEYANVYLKYMKHRFPNRVRTIKILHADNLETLYTEYKHFARELGINTIGQDRSSIIKAVNMKLKTRKNWLLIFDNINDDSEMKDYQTIKQYFPKSDSSKQRGQIILTSRNDWKRWNKYTDQINPAIKSDDQLMEIDLDNDIYRLTENEAVLIFNNITGHQGERDWFKIAELAKMLNYSPLAITRIATLIINKNPRQPYQDSGEIYITHTIYSISQEISREISKEISRKTNKIIQDRLEENKNPSTKNQIKKVNKYHIVNNIVNNKVLTSLSPNAKNLFNWIIFFDLDNLSDALLNKIAVGLGLKLEEVGDIKNELMSYNIIARRGGTNYKTHRSFFFANTLEKHDTLKAIITFLNTNTTARNYTKEEREFNSMFVPHVINFIKHVERVYGKKADKNLLLDSIHFLCKIANNCYLNGHLEKANELMTQALSSLKSFDIRLEELKTGDEIITLCQNLINTEKDPSNLQIIKKLPTLLAIILYQSGRSYIYSKSPDNFPREKDFLTWAGQLIEEIDTDSKHINYDKHYDDEFPYKYVIQQNGLWYLLTNKQKTKENIIYTIFKQSLQALEMVQRHTTKITTLLDLIEKYKQIVNERKVVYKTLEEQYFQALKAVENYKSLDSQFPEDLRGKFHRNRCITGAYTIAAQAAENINVINEYERYCLVDGTDQLPIISWQEKAQTQYDNALPYSLHTIEALLLQGKFEEIMSSVIFTESKQSSFQNEETTKKAIKEATLFFSKWYYIELLQLLGRKNHPDKRSLYYQEQIELFGKKLNGIKDVELEKINTAANFTEVEKAEQHAQLSEKNTVYLQKDKENFLKKIAHILAEQSLKFIDNMQATGKIDKDFKTFKADRAADYLNNIAEIYFDLNNSEINNDIAENIYFEVAEVEKKEGSNYTHSSSLARAYGGLAKIYQRKNQYEQAHRFAECSIKIQRTLSRSEKHPEFQEMDLLMKQLEAELAKNPFDSALACLKMI